jgi:hypothetical protein
MGSGSKCITVFRIARVDLNQPELLANDGLAASDGNPQFRQQMLYAVAMRTIDVFERCLTPAKGSSGTLSKHYSSNRPITSAG